MAQGKPLRQFAMQPILALTALTALTALVAVITLVLMTATVARAQTLTTLHSFCLGHYAVCPNGETPNALIQATDGDFYGTTILGGAEGYVCDGISDVGCGTAFKITASGSLTTLHRFCVTSTCADGMFPGSLIEATNGNFYGTTEYGGVNGNGDCAFSGGCGTVFKITPGGDLTTLYTFCSQSNCADGSIPEAGLIQASNGDLYGTAAVGGANSGVNGEGGTVFKITPSGQLTTLYSFCSQPKCTDGYGPEAALVQASNGDLYGSTTAGGTNGGGTVFKITPSGELATLYNFCSQPACADGFFPAAALIQASNGDFYGTTTEGGINGNVACPTSVFYTGCGTVFKLTPGGTLTTLYSFCSQPNCADGSVPVAGLIQATNGDLYGTTALGGTKFHPGTIFVLSLGGPLTLLYSFCSETPCNSSDPVTPLLQGTNGSLYGTTEGSIAGGGTIFTLNVGLSPFVALQTTSGKVGAKVTILGTDLTGATSVTFTGTSATFTVNANGSAITATVPIGATTGTVQVLTPNGTLNSNVVYRVD